MSSLPSCGVVVLPGTRPELVERTIESVRAQSPPPLEIVVAGDRVLDVRGELVAFVRAGDRYLEGKLERQAQALARKPRAALSMTGHRRSAADGRVVAEFGAVATSTDTLLGGEPVELSTVVARNELRGWPGLLALLERPGGDAVVCARLADAAPIAAVEEPLADVLLDPLRHGTDPGHRIAQLLTLMSDPLGRSCAGAPVLRRELLTLLYLELDPGPRDGMPQVELPAVDLTALTGLGPDDAAAVVADLQWALERQAERIATERTSWPAGEVAVDLERPEPPDRELEELEAELARAYKATVADRAETDRLHTVVAEGATTIEWLHAEIGARDAEIERLRGELRAGGGGP